MSKIELEQISEDTVEVVLPPETPMEMATQLIKGLQARGLVEDLAKSTVSVRYFTRPTTKAATVADELIKSLQKLTKDELPYWHPKSQFENQKRVREMEISERRAKNGIKQPSNVSTAPQPLVMPDAAPTTPAPAASMSTMTPARGTAPKMYDTTPAAMNTAGGTGRRYASIPDPVGKGEDEDEVEKSGYGPKGAGQYSMADNIRRKANNTGDAVGAGPNVNVKSYSSKPGQLSAKQSAAVEAKKLASINRKQPVKVASAEEIAAENKKRGLAKSQWGQHLPFPSAEEEIMALAAQDQTMQGDDAAAQQLAKMMTSKAMFSNHKQPSKAEFDAAGEAMGLGVTEEMEKAANHKWNNTMNWLQEATKPISSRFASEEEEMAYWASIKVAGTGGDDSGY